jgi:hypothetical protein
MARITTIDDALARFRTGKLADAQKALEEIAHEIEHSAADLLLEVRNDVYLEQMTEIRKIQKKQTDLETSVGVLDTESLETMASDLVKQLGTADPEALSDTQVRELEGILWSALGSEFEALSTSDRGAMIKAAKTGAAALKKWLDTKIDVLRQQAKKMLGEANFFAAEAYLSEGPLQHIVFGNQSGNPEIFAALKPEHFLGSINEQCGDFCKDVGHYEKKGNPPSQEDPSGYGLAFYQTSKYLHRMLEGVLKLAQKDGFEDIESKLSKINGKSVAELMGLIESKLLPIRGEKAEYAGMDETGKRTAAQLKAEEIYGVESIAALKALVLRLSGELNTAVRKELTLRSSVEQDRQIFQNRESVSGD